MKLETLYCVVSLTTFNLSLIASAIPVAFGAGVGYYATYAVRSQWLGQTVWHGRTDTSSVALTFDDGPSDDTEFVLDALGLAGARATFFMVGQQVETLSHVARRARSEGHEIGNHSYSHPIYLYRSARETRSQLRRAQDVIMEKVGVRPRFSRPPCGVRTPAYFSAALEMNLRTVQWTVAGFDWKKLDAERIARNVLKNARAGSIILLHDGDSQRRRDRKETVQALPSIINGLRERGLCVVPLSQLLAIDDAA